jgi:hypothetical protein
LGKYTVAAGVTVFSTLTQVEEVESADVDGAVRIDAPMVRKVKPTAMNFGAKLFSREFLSIAN